MAQSGYPNARPAALAAVYAILAALMAGAASVAVQGGTIAGYALFVVLIAITIGLAVLAYSAIGRARASGSTES